jgi:hypothetical protein
MCDFSTLYSLEFTIMGEKRWSSLPQKHLGILS